MKPIEKTIIDLMTSSLKEAVNEKVTPYDTTAKVLRTDGSTAWVHIPGGVQETPIAKTIDCKPGDVVQVRISGHSGTLTGNATVPPTGDAEAIKAATSAGLAQIKAAAAAVDISAIVTALTTNENGIDSDGNVIANILQTMVRPYETGVLVGQEWYAYGHNRRGPRSNSRCSRQQYAVRLSSVWAVDRRVYGWF